MSAVAEPGSLSQRVAQRRRAREERRGSTTVLSVPGYEDLLAVRYRRLDGAEMQAIVERPSFDGDAQAGPLDMLITACVDLLEVAGRDENGARTYVPLGRRWTSQTVAELFELDLSPDTTVRSALREALDYKEISQHFAEYVQWVESLESEQAAETPGESGPSDEG